MRVLISGGGTGGHIYPAIAVADELRRRDTSIDILFVGALGRMEMNIVPKAGYSIEGIPISGFNRKQLWKNYNFPLKLFKSLQQCKRILKKFNPDVAAGFGGYASGPMLRVASNHGIPSLVQEQNSYPGVTNKLLARKAKKICVAYPNMERFFPAGKIVFTGNPIRSSIMNSEVSKKDALEYFDLDPHKKTVVIIGGSQGAKTLNQAMTQNSESIAAQKQIQYIWQVGSYYWPEYQKTKVSRFNHVKALQFIDRMDYAYAAADVMICRAGAGTISELSLAKVPSILVPSPNVAEDHQTHNARSLTNEGAAILLRDDRCSDDFIEIINDVIYDEERLQTMSKRISKFSRPNAAVDIVNELLSISK